MKEWIFQIKLSQGHSMFDKQIITQAIVEAESKPDVIKYIEINYPEYFEGNRVAQKLSRKSEQIVYVTIYELDDYWSSYWKQEVECCVCGKKVPLIEIRNFKDNQVSLTDFTCSLDCKSHLPEVKARRTEEYWESQCDYYYIYKITNKIDGRCYIGYTAREVVYRWWEHLKHSELPIGVALREGLEHFTFEVLEKHSKDSTTIDEMHKLETSYIQKFNSIENGYNCILSKSDK